MKRVLGEIVPQPDRDDTRVIRIFLWLPLVVANADGKREMRWLEWAKIKQRYTTFFKSKSLQSYAPGEWRNEVWDE